MDAIGHYLKNIGKIPRLTHEDTLRLSMAVQRGLEAERFQAWLKAHPQWRSTIELERIHRLCRQRIPVGQRAQRKLVEANLKLAYKKASQYSHMDLPLEDRVQAANEGLIEAVKRFNPYKGWRFSTYACWWIFESVSRQNNYTGKMIRVTHTAARLHAQLVKCRSAILERGDEPTAQTLADEYFRRYDKAISPEKAIAGLSVHRPVQSLDIQYGDEGCTLEELLADPNTIDPYEAVEAQERQEAINAGLAYIDLYPDPRGQIVREAYLKGKSSWEIARTMERPRNRVEELTCKGLAQMKERPEIKALR